MSQETFEIAKLIVTVVFALLAFAWTRFIYPWIKENVEEKKIESVRAWAETFVFMAQQVFGDIPGPEKKAIVIDRLREILLQKDIDLSEQQISDIIEAAVKGMKIAEDAGVAVEYSFDPEKFTVEKDETKTGEGGV